MNRYTLIIISSVAVYAGVCSLLYFFQEKFIFFPDKLPRNHVFSFKNFEEISLPVEKNVAVNSVLFISQEKKGVVLFLHGNAGSISGWGQGAGLYLDSGYDILYLDYRGYGKSEGHIESEPQLIGDAQMVYDYLKKRYGENRVIVSGTSIGTGIAAKLASVNNPRCLVLSAPYYSLRSLIKEKVPIVPNFIIKYSLETYRFLQKVKCPIIVFHGSKDELIPIKHSTDLKMMHPKLDLNIIEGYGHNDVPNSSAYVSRMNEVLR